MQELLVVLKPHVDLDHRLALLLGWLEARLDRPVVYRERQVLTWLLREKMPVLPLPLIFNDPELPTPSRPRDPAATAGIDRGRMLKFIHKVGRIHWRDADAISDYLIAYKRQLGLLDGRLTSPLPVYDVERAIQFVQSRCSYYKRPMLLRYDHYETIYLAAAGLLTFGVPGLAPTLAPPPAPEGCAPCLGGLHAQRPAKRRTMARYRSTRKSGPNGSTRSP